MADNRLTQLIKRTLFARDGETINAVLGDHDGVVSTGQPYEVYARVGSGVVFKVRNYTVPNTLDLRVKIGKNKYQNFWQVVSYRDAYAEPTTPNIPDHNDIHRYLPIYRDQIVNLNGYPVSGALSVQIMGSDVIIDGLWITVPSTLFDLTASLPTVGARWVLFQFNKGTGVVTTVDGVLEDSRETLTNADIPLPDEDNVPFLAVRMYESQTQFLYKDDFVRPFNVSGSAIPLTSAGIYTAPTITDNADGTITLGSGEYVFAADSDGSTPFVKYTIAGDDYSLTDESTNYIVANLNSGSPTITVVTSTSTIDNQTVIAILTVYRSGTHLDILEWDLPAKGLAGKLMRRFVRTRRFDVEPGGLRLGEVATRTVTVTAGVVWNGAHDAALASFDSSTDDMSLYAHVSGVWTKSTITQYNNTQYDDGTDLVTLTNNRYAVNWVFRAVNDNQHEVYIVLGVDDYSLPQAEAAILPSSLPPEIVSTSVLLGKIIVEKSASSATEIASAFDQSFNFSPVFEAADVGAIPVDGWIAKSETWVARTQAYTNNPAPGSNIVLNVANTAGFVVGNRVTVSSSAGSEIANITTVVANTSITVDVLALNHTLTTPLITHNHGFTIAGDLSANLDYDPGIKVKFTNSTVKKGLIFSRSVVSSVTYITLMNNDDYLTANAAISSPYISKIENPDDFPVIFNYTALHPDSNGGMTYTSVTATSSWLVTGKRQIAIVSTGTGTTGGSADSEVQFTMPNTGVTLINYPTSFYIDGSGGFLLGNGATGSAGGMDIGISRKFDSSNWGLGASRSYRWSATVRY